MNSRLDSQLDTLQKLIAMIKYANREGEYSQLRGV